MNYLLCCAVKDGPATIRGSVVNYCWFCAEQVWTTPASLRTAGPDVTICCIPCGTGVAESHSDARLQPPSSDQLRELREERQ